MTNQAIHLSPPEDAVDILDEAEPEYDWLIPGLLERGDRLILTGGEGKGKSTLLRQMAVQVSLGIHPFTLEPIEPKKVWHVDLENPRALSRRKLMELTRDHGRTLIRGNLQMNRWPGGLDLTQQSIAEATTSILYNMRPDLVVIGPTYKMAQHLEQEAASSLLAFTLDQWRQVFNFALIMESHQPHQTVVEGKNWRAERPFGSSLWMRWPEFGICLEDAGTLRHWRGARDTRDWPTKLLRGDEWPWVVDNSLCLVCGFPRTGKQEKYCSERCGNAARQATFRANLRVV